MYVIELVGRVDIRACNGLSNMIIRRPPGDFTENDKSTSQIGLLGNLDSPFKDGVQDVEDAYSEIKLLSFVRHFKIIVRIIPG